MKSDNLKTDMCFYFLNVIISDNFNGMHMVGI